MPPHLSGGDLLANGIEVVLRLFGRRVDAPDKRLVDLFQSAAKCLKGVTDCRSRPPEEFIQIDR